MPTAREVLDAIDLTAGLPAELLAEDVVVETPTAASGPRRFEGREAFLAHAAAGRASLPFRLHTQRLVAVHATTDPQTLVVEYELTGTALATGRRATASFVAVLRTRDGLITRWREYQDTAAIARAGEPGNTREQADELVARMQECFNTREFDAADDLFAPGYVMHPGGAVGFETGKDAWRRLVARYPEVRVVAEDVLVDGAAVTVRSTVDGVGTGDGEPPPSLIEVFTVVDGRFVAWWGSTWVPSL